jgi:imidazolonepropionase-like amidohydrolase
MMIWLRRLACMAFLVPITSVAQPITQVAPPDGLRDNTPSLVAVIGARVITEPGSTLENATLVFQNGILQSVGAGMAVPPGARIFDLTGKTIYPGFIDSYSELSADSQKADTTTSRGAPYWNDNILPQRRASSLYKPDAKLDEDYRSVGLVARLVAPTGGQLKGTSFVTRSSARTGASDDASIIRDDVALHASMSPVRGEDRGYPTSPMGAYALIRQALYDARWYTAAQLAVRGNTLLPHVEKNDALDALSAILTANTPLVIDAVDDLYAIRASRLGEEFNLPIIIRGSGQEYRQVPALAKTGRAVITPLNFPKPPNVASVDQAESVTLEELMAWDLSPENPARLDAAGIRIAFTSNGLKERKEFLPALRKAVARGLSKDSALRALTTTPARLLKVDHCLGKLEPGKCASFIVTDGDLFEPKTKILQTWVEGERFDIAPTYAHDPRGQWQLTVGANTYTLDIRSEGSALKASLITDGDKRKDISTFSLVDAAISLAIPTGEDKDADRVRISAVIDGDTWRGLADVAGQRQPVTASRTKTIAELTATSQPATRPAPRMALFQPNYPLGEYGTPGLPDQPEVIVFTGVTVWTGTAEGNLDNAAVVVRRGKIDAVLKAGAPLPSLPGAVTIDGQGKHLAAGIIDAHSHMASDSGINESGQAITAEVRIGDFINPEDMTIYRQLAGGVTAASILHGSANPIGGQNQVIKLRWGGAEDDLKFTAAPQGIKFALGENVKQSNWGERFTTRYPQTRMGVPELIADSFRAAQDYRRRQKAAQADPRNNLPVRKDLELEALAEIIEGTRWIHCHSYRQDEILAFLRVCESFGIKVGSLQHILEGYKVADAIAKHGATASCFTDWWGYKFEVIDAIPYAAEIMHNRGIVVSFNSDDGEMARRLNLEAAKAIKYGNIPPLEAWKMVTLNPAKQLRIDQFVGSIEAGKDADLVLWSGQPMASSSVAEQTWIDGRKYFDRTEDRQRQKQVADMRQSLIARVLASGESPAGPDEPNGTLRPEWPNIDEFCTHGHTHNH